MDIVIQVLFGVVLVFFVCWLLTPRRAFVIRIHQGQPNVVRGRVSAAFLMEVGDVCRDFGVRQGTIWGNWRGKHIQLAFSGSIPPACQQRLRNVWQLGP